MGAVRDRTQEQPQTVRLRRGWPWVVAALLAVPLLLFCYLRIAGTTEVNADAAGLVLQANDMLHGNLLLHGWWDTDVSFITTELPEYMAVTAVAGIRPEVVHICAAVTYTLLVLLAAGVARGRARGAEGAVRALVGAGVMLAPQPAWTTPVMLGSPDHVGTAVPLLLLLLLLDRAPRTRARLRWYIPAGGGVCVITAALLAAVLVGDPLAEVVGVVPLVIACLLRVIRIVAIRLVRVWRARRGGEPAQTAVDTRDGHDARGSAADDTSWRSACYHVLLAASAAAAVPLAGAANSWIRRDGGYQLGPNRYGLLPWHQIVANAPTVWQSFLALFGADYTGVTGWHVVIALAHLVGVAVVLAAVALAVWRLLVPARAARAARAGDLVADFLVLAVLVNVVAFLTFVKPVNIYDAHEIGPVASFGAALAGRVLAPMLWSSPLLRFRLPRPRTPVLLPVLAAVLACYAAFLGLGAAMPQGPPQHVALANWLSQHNLRSGLASYWESSSVTVESGDKITMLAVGIHGWKRLLGPDAWETDVLLADPATHSANFLVVGPDRIVPAKLAVQMFGKPARTYQFAPYTIMVWNKNLIAELNH